MNESCCEYAWLLLFLCIAEALLGLCLWFVQRTELNELRRQIREAENSIDSKFDEARKLQELRRMLRQIASLDQVERTRAMGRGTRDEDRREMDYGTAGQER